MSIAFFTSKNYQDICLYTAQSRKPSSPTSLVQSTEAYDLPRVEEGHFGYIEVSSVPHLPLGMGKSVGILRGARIHAQKGTLGFVSSCRDGAPDLGQSEEPDF